MLVILALGIIGFAIADDASDEAKVDNGTMDTSTTVAGYVYVSDQSVNGTGLISIYNNLAAVSPSDTSSQVLNLRNLRSGSGDYNDDSSVRLQYNVMGSEEDISLVPKEEIKEHLNPNQEFISTILTIASIADTRAVYSPISLQIPGSFRAKTIKSLWKDQTCGKNFAGEISMDYLIDYAKVFHTQSTTVLYSSAYKYEDLPYAINSSLGSIMHFNSKFVDGSAHLGTTLNDVRGGISGITKSQANSTVLMDEDYRGSFNLTKKMDVKITKTTDFGDYEANYEGVYEDYPWLPCLCNVGWDDMAIHDKRYHSAKDFFDCTTCWPPAPCKN